jgi:hypothetical protein
VAQVIPSSESVSASFILVECATILLVSKLAQSEEGKFSEEVQTDGKHITESEPGPYIYYTGTLPDCT